MKIKGVVTFKQLSALIAWNFCEGYLSTIGEIVGEGKEISGRFELNLAFATVDHKTVTE